MKDKVKKIILLTLVLGIASMSSSLGKEKWKGKVFKEGEITIIENEGDGLWGKKIEEKIKFEETLSLGVEEGEDYLMFGREVSIDVDPSQNIYLLDHQNHRVLKFDKNGKFLWQAGRKGQGPGEFQYSMGIKITQEGNLAVLDGGRLIHYFNPDGKFVNTMRLDKSFHEIEFLRHGTMFVNIFVRGQPGITAEYYSKDGKFLKKFPDEYYYGPKIPPGVGFSMGGAFKLSKDKIYLSLPEKYEIREYDLNGKTLRKIIRNVSLKSPEFRIFAEGRRITMRPKDISGPCFPFKDGMIINSVSFVRGNEKKPF
ncbi:MAG: 6-bladed beta-propeller [Acidobacteriota bacterium]